MISHNYFISFHYSVMYLWYSCIPLRNRRFLPQSSSITLGSSGHHINTLHSSKDTFYTVFTVLTTRSRCKHTDFTNKPNVFSNMTKKYSTTSHWRRYHILLLVTRISHVKRVIMVISSSWDNVRYKLWHIQNRRFSHWSTVMIYWE